jgi:hypothetical protein
MVMQIVEKYTIIVDVALLLLSLSPMPVDYWGSKGTSEGT